MSERFLCLRCWRTPRRTEALYRCAACDAGDTGPGAVSLPAWLPATTAASSDKRPVSDLLPPRWRRWLSTARVPEFCPDHPTTRLELFCPCERPLSAKGELFGEPVGLGFAGPRSSGKTLLTITAISELGGRSDFPPGSQRYNLLGFDGTEERFGALSGQLLRQGQRPLITMPELGEALEFDTSHNFAWNVFETNRGRKRPTPRAVLAVYDVAGEVWGLPPHERSSRLDRYLGLLGSLVFVLDGASIAADLGLPTEDAWQANDFERETRGATDLEWFDRVRQRLDHLNRQRRTDLALVISKADHLWEAHPDLQSEASQETLEKLLRDTGRSGLVAAGRAEFRRVKLFAASSLGFRPGPGDVDAEGRLLRAPQPKGVTAPLLWLLDERLGKGQ
ncbi:MAG TPA: hypothetical protein VN851_28380 [Thermoanaerobaculia bacterium]|nr:hypothetical protein [Thermoanaerobaculia bacterium]